MSDKKATSFYRWIDEAIELPIYSGTLGPDVVDVGGLTGQGHVHLRSRFCLHRRLRITDHLYRWR